MFDGQFGPSNEYATYNFISLFSGFAREKK